MDSEELSYSYFVSYICNDNDELGIKAVNIRLAKSISSFEDIKLLVKIIENSSKEKDVVILNYKLLSE